VTILPAWSGAYVAMHFPVPTTFGTSYIIDGSPREIVADEVVFLLDLADRPETMIITRLGDGCGVWDTSRDRDELRDLVDPYLPDPAAS
jgi:hypothetical protein